MILDISSFEYIPNNNAKEILLQYRFKTDWQRIHLELCIRSGFSFCVLKDNNGFIICIDDFKDGTIFFIIKIIIIFVSLFILAYFIFAASEEDLEAGIANLKLNSSHNTPTDKIFILSLGIFNDIL